MNKLKKLIKQYFTGFAFFYSHLKEKLLYVFLISFTLGLLDAVGLTMFLPLIKLADGDHELKPEEAGDFEGVVAWLNEAGLSLTLEVILAFLVFFFFLKGIFKYFSHYYMVFVQQFFVSNLRLKLANALKNYSYKAYIQVDVGRVQNVLTGEVAKVSMAVQSYYKSFEQLILVLVYSAFAVLVDYKFATMALIGGALSNLAYRSIFNKTKESSYQVSNQGNLFQNKIIQFIGNFKYLKASGSADVFYQKIVESIKIIKKLQLRIGKLKATLFASKEPLLVAVLVLAMILQIRFFNAGITSMLVSLLFFYRALGAFMIMQNQWNTYLGVSGALENTKEFLQLLNKDKETTGTQKLRQTIPQIELKNIDFAFNPSEKVLHKINLTIAPKETVAFVGESGSGKSTLVNIICGLLKPSKGEVFLQNQNLADLNIKSLQRRIGYITQEPVIFNDTLYNNITLWQERNKENLERFNQVLKEASIYDFVQSLALKDQHKLENAGINLSGGQKQRISIARELYKKVDLLIMDEATSALDSETERAIQKNIDALKGKYTMLIVAHRLSTVKNADKIVVLNSGKIEDMGSFEELMQRTPRFRKMVELQEL
jgi:subfamily B ATP-binding cassette protein MsbA